MPDNADWLNTATEIVQRAGALQMESFGGDLRITKKGTIDLVTEVDVAVEQMGRAVLAERFPTHQVLAEELENAPVGAQARYRWVFDPLDGTVNYAHGLPIFCSCLSLEINGCPEVAAVYDPTRRELFTAQRGAGAWLNGDRLQVSNAETVIDSLLCTGFPYNVHETVDEVVGLFGEFVARARAVRRLGSAALDLCYVAAGRFDGFWEQRLHPWDMSAGSLVVDEAGGRLSTLEGDLFETECGQIVASNGRIHDEMLRVIASHRGRSAGGGARE